MVSAKCAKRKYSYLLPTTPVLRLEGSRTLLEFLHRIHFHVDFQPHLRILSTSYMSHFHGRWAGILPGRQDSRATDNQTIHSIPTLPYSSRQRGPTSSAIHHDSTCIVGQGSFTVRLVQYLLSDGIRESPVRMASSSHTGQNSLPGLHAELRRCQGPRNA